MIDLNLVHNRIKPHILKSPLIYSDWLSKLVNGKVYLKLECLQPSRSFKIRGATNALLSKKNYTSVVAASGGNHGLALSIAAAKLGKSCKIVVPKTTSKNRIDLIKEVGAEVIIHGKAFDEADTYAKNLAEVEGGVYIHPFADPDVMYGQGTVALEILRELPETQIIMASIGGGGLLGGICSAVKFLQRRDNVVLYGVETEGTDSMYQSLKAKRIIKLDAITSIATTLGAKETRELNFDIISRMVKEIFLVNDTDTVKALNEFLENEKILLEPAASCLIPALEENKKLFEGKVIVLVICGSNTSLEEVETWNRKFLT